MRRLSVIDVTAASPQQQCKIMAVMTKKVKIFILKVYVSLWAFFFFDRYTWYTIGFLKLSTGFSNDFYLLCYFSPIAHSLDVYVIMLNRRHKTQKISLVSRIYKIFNQKWGKILCLPTLTIRNQQSESNCFKWCNDVL